MGETRLLTRQVVAENGGVGLYPLSHRERLARLTALRRIIFIKRVLQNVNLRTKSGQLHVYAAFIPRMQAQVACKMSHLVQQRAMDFPRLLSKDFLHLCGGLLVQKRCLRHQRHEEGWVEGAPRQAGRR